MSNVLPTDFPGIYLLPLLLIGLLIVWVIIRKRRGQVRSLAGILNDIAFDRIEKLVIPNVDEGEIQIDFLILTAQGLLIVDVKDVKGSVFGSDKMQDWTVISDNHHFTFSNPQPALHDRIAAVRQIVRQVPVEGRVVFLDGASFAKGRPSLVCGLDDLTEQFGEKNRATAVVKIEAFKPHWELIKRKAEAAAAKTGKREASGD
jgi:hypothetical protein